MQSNELFTCRVLMSQTQSKPSGCEKLTASRAPLNWSLSSASWLEEWIIDWND